MKLNVNVEVNMKIYVNVDRNVMLNVLVHARQSGTCKFTSKCKLYKLKM